MERRSTDKVFDTILREEVRKLNQHLPKQRRKLVELLKEESPEVTSLDGGKIIMNKNELEHFAADLSADAVKTVELPIVLIRRTELGTGAFTVLGGKPEEYAMATHLGRFQGTLEDYRKEWKQELVVYKPEVSALIRRFHSLVVVGFGISEGLFSS